MKKEKKVNYSVLDKCRSNWNRAAIYFVSSGFICITSLFFDNKFAEYIYHVSLFFFGLIGLLLLLQHFEALIRLGSISSITTTDIHGLDDSRWRIILRETGGWPTHDYLQTRRYKDLEKIE